MSNVVHHYDADQEKFLAEICKTKASYGEITRSFNERFGTSVSRSAILGKADRMGIRAEKPSSKGRSNTRPQHVRQKRQRSFGSLPASPRPQAPREEELLRSEDDRGQKLTRSKAVDVASVFDDTSSTRKSFLTLCRGECKWPASEDASMACGAPVTIGSYCTCHAEIAYRTMPTRSRNRKVLAGAGYVDTRRTELEISDEQTLAPDLIPSFLPKEEVS